MADATIRLLNAAKGCASGIEDVRRIVERTAKHETRTKTDENNADEKAIMLACIELIEEEEKERHGDKYVLVSSENPAGSQGALAGRPWQCKIYTLVNAAIYLSCNACGIERIALVYFSSENLIKQGIVSFISSSRTDHRGWIEDIFESDRLD